MKKGGDSLPQEGSRNQGPGEGLPLGIRLDQEEPWRLVMLSPAMARLEEAISGLATWEGPVFIRGESGTGKELVAKSLHDNGARKDGLLVKLVCSRLTPGDLEAAHAWQGLMGGEVILDEVSDLAPESQAVLCAELTRGDLASPQAPRLVALSLRDLKVMTDQGTFHAGLASHLNPVCLEVPPLRQRQEDLPVLAERLLSHACRCRGLRPSRITPPAMELLLGHSWPGNVRELINALEYALMLAPAGLVGPDHLPPTITGHQ